MTINAHLVENHIDVRYSITISFRHTSKCSVDEVGLFVEKYERSNPGSIEYFTGNPACFPYLTFSNTVKSTCIHFVKAAEKFFAGNNIKVSL